MERSSRSQRIGRAAVRALLAVVAALVGVNGVASAHDEIESSVPAHQSQFDDPISEVTIEFGAPVGGVELALVDPDNNDVADTSVTRLGNTAARLSFPELDRQGEYIVRYLAEEDGHLVNGAISFVYGSRDGGGAGTSTWLAFGALAVVLLTIGALWSWRLSQRDDTIHPQPEPA